MKAYNKKGLITGTIFCVIGAFSLIKNLTVPSDLMILQIRNIVISFLALSIGLNSLIRALSKKCTEEDISSKINVRNSIVKLKSLCSALVILQALIFICVILSMIAFYFTENILTVAIILVKILLSKGLALVLIILSFMLKGKQLYKSTLEWNEYFFIAE